MFRAFTRLFDGAFYGWIMYGLAIRYGIPITDANLAIQSLSGMTNEALRRVALRFDA